MGLRYYYWIVFGLVLFSLPLRSQEEKPKNWTLQGYVKDLQSVYSIDQIDSYIMDNLIHNRLKFRWYPSDNWTVRVEMRNRLFYGDLVKMTPNFADVVEEGNNDYFDFSFNLIDKPGWLLNANFDRAYVQYVKGNLEASLGRQRINWGISTVWNPNDIFNTFSYTDFDYEERPGSDAARIKYYTGVASSIEIAANIADTWDERVMAVMYKWNMATYDMQLLAGVARGDYVIGTGWAGNIKNAGFKGEASYFIPFAADSTHSFSFTTGIDYSFANSLYISGGYLYNSIGGTDGSSGEIFVFEPSAKNLYPFRHAIFASASYPVTPLFSTLLAVIYSPVKSQPLFINPTFTLSVAQNWDLDLVGQISFSDVAGKYKTPVTAAFLRIKYSF